VCLKRGAHHDLQAAHGAFADFLGPGLTSYGPLRNRAVAIVNGPSGTVEVYRAPPTHGADTKLIALHYEPARYQWLRWTGPGPTLAEFEAACREGGGPPPAPAPPWYIAIDAEPPAIIEIDD